MIAPGRGSIASRGSVESSLIEMRNHPRGVASME
jgi:hypothetical protein